MPNKSFSGKYSFLSNFKPCRNGVMYEGDMYPTSEHAYQAAKIEERHGRHSFICGGSLGDNPRAAKRKSKTIKIRGAWGAMKVDVMTEVVRSKFERDTGFQQKLHATRKETLREEGTGDTFWGGTRNHLGRILMRVRDELRQQTIPQPTPQEDSDDARPKLKEKSKGNLQHQALFKQKLEAWEDINDVSADHTDLVGQCVEEAPTLSAETKRQWMALGREAKAASEQAANEDDVEQKRCALRDVIASCGRAAALCPSFPMPLLARALAELASLQEDAASEPSTQISLDDVASQASTDVSTPREIATEAMLIQSCHDSSWHGWYCNHCGTCVPELADGQCDDSPFVDAVCAEQIARRIRPRGGRSRWKRNYDADHIEQIAHVSRWQAFRG